MKYLAVVCLFSVGAVSVIAQSHPGRGIYGGGTGITPVPDAIATFDGVFKSADKKFVEIQVESGDIMRMYITGKTKFILDGKQVKAGAFHDGDKVTADATRDVRMNMLAVRIENKTAGDKAPKPEK